MPELCFEYPLNEKMRHWLRLEFLLEQLVSLQNSTNSQGYLAYFRTLCELLEIVERNELRADLLKELEKQQQKLQAWVAIPGIDRQLVEQLLAELAVHSQQLLHSTKPGSSLKEDRFIGHIRQRIMIPGGYCNFDIPSLYLWLHLTAEKRHAQLEHWYASLSPFHQALQATLHLIRQSGEFTEIDAQQGFYQGTANDKELIRLRLDSLDEVYPQISGHKSRFAIRFLALESETQLSDSYTFQLACC